MENTVIKGAGFHHIALSAADFDKSLKFYTEGLGCGYLRGWGEGTGRAAMLDIGGGAIIELFANGTGKEEQNARFVHLAIKTSDVDGAFAAALKAGAAEKSAPNDVLLQADNPMDIRVAFVYGPDGEILEFFCEK